MRDPELAFQITFLKYDHMKLRYTNYDKKTKCFDLSFERRKYPTYRVRIDRKKPKVDELDGGETDLDTLQHSSDSKRFCTDRLFIWVLGQRRNVP